MEIYNDISSHFIDVAFSLKEKLSRAAQCTRKEVKNEVLDDENRKFIALVTTCVSLTPAEKSLGTA